MENLERLIIMNNDERSNYDLALGFLQVFDVILNISQVSNDVLLKELQKQDKEYLEKIIEQNKTIINQNEIIIELLNKK